MTWLPVFRPDPFFTVQAFQAALARYNNDVRPDLVEIGPSPDGARRYQLTPRVLNRITENFR